MRGYGESHPGSDGRDASAIGNGNYMIARTTRNNNLVKAKKHSTAKLEPNYTHSCNIFNQELETSLANYLEKCSGTFHGL